MSRKSNRKTQDFAGMKYSPELIRQLEDPEYAKRADAYEKEARRQKKADHQDISYDIDEHGTVPSRIRKNAKKSKKGKKKYKLNKLKFVRNLLFVVLLLCIAGSAWFVHLTRTFDRVETNPEDFAITDTVADDLRGYRNIAILGTDGRADESYDTSRTDAIIILSFNRINGDLRMISVMRDSYLKFEYFDGELILDKVTHANVYGGGTNTCAALNRGLDLNIDEFVIFNWKAVSDAVDALGGIEINVKENEISDMNKWGPETGENVGKDYTQITEAGKQTLDGVQATTYCRIRKTSGGDSSRTQRYKKVVVATMKKALTQPWKLNQLSEEVFPNIRTNMSAMDMLSLVTYVPRLDIQSSISWPKEYYAGLLSDGVSYVVPITLESEVQRLHKKAFGAENYNLSDVAAQINEEIIYSTGIQ